MYFHSTFSVPTCTSSNADHLINRLYIRTSVFVSFETIPIFNNPHLWVGVWVNGWGSGQMTNFIKLELIDIIQFCLEKFHITKIK